MVFGLILPQHAVSIEHVSMPLQALVVFGLEEYVMMHWKDLEYQCLFRL